MKYLIISCSLNDDSKSRILGKELAARITDSELIDMRDYPLPLCDGDKAYSDPNVSVLAQKIKDAEGVLVTTPVYNYSTNATLKNLIELTGDAWNNKVVGFACAAGGNSSYMSVLGISNSLMLDFRCLIVPRFLYASSQAFANGAIADAKITQRLEQLADEFVEIAKRMN